MRLTAKEIKKESNDCGLENTNKKEENAIYVEVRERDRRKREEKEEEKEEKKEFI